MKELVVVSGKGGTGKTSLVASLAALADHVVLADCDVDAANLHLLLDPRVNRHEEFRAGYAARIDESRCVGCGDCMERCRFDAVEMREAYSPGGLFSIDEKACEGCGVCAWFCPEQAIELHEQVSGEWYSSDTRYGPMVHARLGIAAENSGKLVTLIRNTAREVAEEKKFDLIILDGSPGIGCPVIASITGCDLVLAVTEPTPSGLHDLERVKELAGFFKLPLMVAINKYDLNEAMTAKIERFCENNGLSVAGKIPYTSAFTEAMVHGKSIVEYGNGDAAGAVKAIWRTIRKKMLNE